MFDWDPRKAEANANKHGASFDEAVTIFLDEDAPDGPDLEHSGSEVRFRRLGRSIEERLLMVVHTEGHEPCRIRIISARRASRRERAAYTQGRQR